MVLIDGSQHNIFGDDFQIEFEPELWGVEYIFLLKPGYRGQKCESGALRESVLLPLKKIEI